jgi:hypothetical protein
MTAANQLANVFQVNVQAVDSPRFRSSMSSCRYLGGGAHKNPPRIFLESRKVSGAALL